MEDTYEAVPERLRFFFRHRGCSSSDIDDLVSESMVRLLNKKQEIEILEPIAYAFGIAKKMMQEYRARRGFADVDIDVAAEVAVKPEMDTLDRELQHRCFGDCFEQLSNRNKKVIRECLQRQPPLPVSLRVRKHRIVHDHLIPCCQKCVERGMRSNPDWGLG